MLIGKLKSSQETKAKISAAKTIADKTEIENALLDKSELKQTHKVEVELIQNEEDEQKKDMSEPKVKRETLKKEAELIHNDEDEKENIISDPQEDDKNSKNNNGKNNGKNNANTTGKIQKHASTLKKPDIANDKVEDDRTVEITQIDDDLDNQLHLPKRQDKTIAEFIE